MSLIERRERTSQYKTKTGFAVEALRDAISNGRMQPGERLIVGRLAEQLGMSATPIREAIRILQAEGWISHQPHRGVSVTDFSLNDAEEIHLLRGLLEGLATSLAVSKVTEAQLDKLENLAARVETAYALGNNKQVMQANAEWHLYIYRISGTHYLEEFLHRLWAVFPWDSIWRIPGRAAQSIAEHTEIMAAIRERDASRASELMRRHILRNQESTLLFLSSASGQQPGQEAEVHSVS